MFLLQSEIFLWDFILLILMTFSLAGGVGCFILSQRPMYKGVQRAATCMLGLVGILGFLLLIYASFIEPQMIVVHRKQVSHPLAEPMTIAVIADPHVGPYKGKPFLERVARKTNELLPDLVLLPGDFVFTRSAHIEDLAPLGDIRASMGVFAVLGNHDVGQYKSLSGIRYAGENRGNRIAQQLESTGIRVLRNEHVNIPITNGTIAIAGIDDIWTGHYDIPAALGGIAANAYTILLSHNPSVIDMPQSLSAHLIVTGHTHGGQMRLPGIGPISDLPTSLGKEFDQGLFSVDDDTTLVITRGVGESSPRTRLFAWPEILLLEVNAEQ